MKNLIDAHWLAQYINDKTSRGIAQTTALLIREGNISIGMQLPKVRVLSEILEVSPATISNAWGKLRKINMIIGQGRTGIWVNDNSITPKPIRFEKIANYGDHINIDLSLANPDPTLLPPLQKALKYSIDDEDLHSYYHKPISQKLKKAISPYWPLKSDAFLATNGGFDAMNLIAQTLFSFGDKVIIENPTASRLLDILDRFNVEMLPVTCDEEGPLPEALTTLLKQAPTAFIYQPRSHSITGHSVTRERSQALAKVLKNSNILIIENDGIGQLSAYPVYSIGTYIPERTIYVQSFSKAYGPDLRVAIASGPNSIIQKIQSVRNYDSRWTSRILQNALAWLIENKNAQKYIVNAKKQYRTLRLKLLTALSDRGLQLPDRDGLNLYIPVISEQFAMITLAVRGIAVSPGDRFRNDKQQFIRISITRIKESQIDIVADAIIIACGRE